MLFKASTAAALLAAVPALAHEYSINAYWGQRGPDTDRLASYCDSDSIDFITLGFVNVSPENGGGYPGTNFAAHCDSPVYALPNGNPSKLLSGCGLIKEDIKICQRKGKKIYLSIGGVYSQAYSNYEVTTEQKGREFADFLWGAFGPKVDSWTGPRPFDWEGSVSMDGFDFDIEHKFPNMLAYAAVVNRLREHIVASQKDVVITAAPECPQGQFFTMESILKRAKFDKIFVQFYNNPANCNAASSGLFNYAAWEKFFKEQTNYTPELYVGLPAAPEAASNGYLAPALVKNLICNTLKKSSMFSGIMLWDAWHGKTNVDVLTRKNYYDSVASYLAFGGCPGEVVTTTSSTISSTSTRTSTTSSSTSTSSTVSTTSSSTTSSASTSSSTSSSATSTSTSVSTSSSTSSSVSSATSTSTSASTSSTASSSASTSSTLSSSTSSATSSSTTSSSATSSSATSSSTTSSSATSSSATSSSSVSSTLSSASTSSTSSSASTSSSVSTSSSASSSTTSSSSSSVSSTASSTSDSSSATVSSSASTVSSTSSTHVPTYPAYPTYAVKNNTESYGAVYPTAPASYYSAASSTKPVYSTSVYTTSGTVYTTVCSETETSKTEAVSSYATTTSSAALTYTTSTIYSTTVYTVTKCPATVTDCPYGSTTTHTVAVSTTVCPVTEEEPYPTATYTTKGGDNDDEVYYPVETPTYAALTETEYPAVEYPTAEHPAGEYPTTKAEYPTVPYPTGGSYPTAPVHGSDTYTTIYMTASTGVVPPATYPTVPAGGPTYPSIPTAGAGRVGAGLAAVVLAAFAVAF
ncbi:glycoside hydrolase superfamily [Microdochium bolleyi]|uniref:chitinase n=1 Tax=Microdochium bolleyi TaxID=196109 RepID=A0A136JA23_9PEZI|nr:glycoside hydrolase superfamily [Microdochium bolleyi]